MQRGKLTWSCHFCGRMRDDPDISVASKPLLNDRGRSVGRENRRYCNDSADCVTKAEAWRLTPGE